MLKKSLKLEKKIVNFKKVRRINSVELKQIAKIDKKIAQIEKNRLN